MITETYAFKTLRFDLASAALAKHYRFLADVRDTADEARVTLVDSEQGVWGCDMVWNCVEICPKSVPPTQGIGKTCARLLASASDGASSRRWDG